MFCVICLEEKKEYIKGLLVYEECYIKAYEAKERAFMRGIPRGGEE